VPDWAKAFGEDGTAMGMMERTIQLHRKRELELPLEAKWNFQVVTLCLWMTPLRQTFQRLGMF
jgi:hypothetical protein